MGGGGGGTDAPNRLFMIYERSRTPSPLRFTVFKAHTVRRTILLYSVNSLQKNRFLKIRRLREFRNTDCTFGARIRKTAGARSCCIPEQLEQRIRRCDITISFISI